MPTTKTIALAIIPLIALAVAGCGEGANTAQSDQAGQPAAPAWLLASVPDGARGVAEVKTSAQEGDQVVLRGRIGGRKEAISDQSSVFVVMDVSVPHCGDVPGDSCPSPWDYCCETPESVTANSATIQLVDGDGQPITESPMTHGFAALDEVVLVGTVAPRPSQDVLTIRATGLFRVGG